ncbi:hypothetical protein [Streptomyces sp. NPDC004232]|uniref:hypothetical protein n=1 Tax=unclassified Streptomyces TaxID=2593676 RepID=UPI0033B9CCFF
MRSKAARPIGIIIAITALVLGAAGTSHTGHAWAPKVTTASDGGPESGNLAAAPSAVAYSDGGPE